ncbi:hypothetical protein [Endozoicomonas numazuensis]|uniref:Uncharacterized protein n=1 Tax=Endozoicomonas numazuensis TaxID=1137799 RepID=A0A081NLC0_9GAMM|nr:hypothetical protein [Endozoicomonas numazuensis]KEQ19243.1 hypothetical protein GZ78_04450 [Endozoicomonas numazuensis]
MNTEAESVGNVMLDESTSPYPGLSEKMTRAELSQKIKDAVAQNQTELLESLFCFMLVNEYTPEQINQELDYIRANNPAIQDSLIRWSEEPKEKKKLKIAGKAVFVAVVIHHASGSFAPAIKAVEKFKSFKDAPHEFAEAVDELEISSWLGLLNHELDNQVPLTNIMRQIEALRLKHIWSKDLAVFAIPVTTAFFREQANEKLLDGDFIGAYRDLEQALKLSEEDKSATYQAYADCIVRQVNDPLFRSRASKKDLEKLSAKMEYLHDVDFWTPELDIGRFHLKNMIGEI